MLRRVNLKVYCRHCVPSIKRSSYFALVCGRDSSLTVLIDDGCGAVTTLDRTEPDALFDRDVLLLFTLSYSLNRGVIPVAGRTTFCRKPKRLPRAAAVGGCVWSRLGGWRRGVVRPVGSLSPVFCSPENRSFMFSPRLRLHLHFTRKSRSFPRLLTLIEMSRNTKVNVKSCFNYKTSSFRCKCPLGYQ